MTTSPFGVAVAVGLSLCACGSAATPAMARDLPSGFPAASAAVASPSSGAFAYLASFGTLRVRSTTNRTLPVPAACAPEAIFGRHVILCADKPVASGATLDLDVDTGAVHPVAVSPLGAGVEERFIPTRLGAAWLAGTIGYTSPFGSGKGIEVPVVVSRATGKTIDVTATGLRSLAWGPKRFVDLGSRRPARRLCAPVRRVPIPAFPTVGDFDTLIKVGSWTLQSVSKQSQEPSYLLQRCGSRRRFKTGFQAVLGRGYAAWVSEDARPGARPDVVVKDLRRGTTRRYRTSSTVELAFSRDRLIVSQLSAGGPRPWRITVLKLRHRGRG